MLNVTPTVYRSRLVYVPPPLSNLYVDIPPPMNLASVPNTKPISHIKPLNLKYIRRDLRLLKLEKRRF